MAHKQTWLIEPRDPLVLGNGRGYIPFTDTQGFRLPMPGTAAGTVRSAFVEDRAKIDDQRARALLGIRIKGPWLVQERSEGNPKYSHWATPPADACWDFEKKVLLRAVIDRLGPGEGMLAPIGTHPLSFSCIPRIYDEAGLKTKACEEPWPLEWVVGWNLGRKIDPVVENLEPLHLEHRTHVTLDDATGTAADGELFGSSGTRFPENWKLVVEVTASDDLSFPAEMGFVNLGGRSRLSFRKRLEEAAVPSFDSFRKDYGDCIEQALAKRTLRGLRLQLLTPAYLPTAGSDYGRPAWLPSWHGREPLRVTTGGDCVRHLKLAGVCLPGRCVVRSGWNLRSGQQGAPRRVRRLVPAGTVYFLEIDPPSRVSTEDWIALCERFWYGFLDDKNPHDQESPERFRASADADGCGIVLPGIW